MFGPRAAYFAELFRQSPHYGGFASARELGSIVSAVRLALFPLVCGTSNLTVWSAAT
jgi:hypothetical protein